MKPQDAPRSLDVLKEDIERLQRKTTPKAEKKPPEGMQAALRMGAELASGVLVGAGVGILLDKWLNTSPLLCIICFLLGAGGGFLTIYRTMRSMDTGEAAGPAPDDEDDD